MHFLYLFLLSLQKSPPSTEIKRIRQTILCNAQCFRSQVTDQRLGRENDTCLYTVIFPVLMDGKTKPEVKNSLLSIHDGQQLSGLAIICTSIISANDLSFCSKS